MPPLRSGRAFHRLQMKLSNKRCCDSFHRAKVHKGTEAIGGIVAQTIVKAQGIGTPFTAQQAHAPRHMCRLCCECLRHKQHIGLVVPVVPRAPPFSYPVVQLPIDQCQFFIGHGSMPSRIRRMI
jgi:hypothetical protein